MTQNETPPSVPYADESTPADASSMHNLGVLAIALLGLYLIVVAVRELLFNGVVILLPLSANASWADAAIVAEPIVSLAIGTMLLLQAPGLSRWILGRSALNFPLPRIVISEVQAIAISVAGLVFVMLGAVEIARNVAAEVIEGYGIMREELIYFAPGAVQVVLGLVLFFQARGLANLWQRVRQSPTEPNTPTERESASE